jgi:hypothetical protein
VVLTGAGTATVALGERLRPIVLGAPPPELTALGGSGGAPEVVLSVHGAEGDVLGYAVLDRIVAGDTRGGLTVSAELSLSDALLLARTTSLQLRLGGLQAGAHHCVLTKAATPGGEARARRAFLHALAPLLSAGLLELTYTTDARGTEPALARDSLIASAAAGVLGVLDHCSLEPARATFALRGSTRLARDVGAMLRSRGMRERRRGGAGETDVLVLDGSPRPLRLEEALQLRARAIVLLSTRAFATAAERQLHERGTFVVPDTIATLGRLLSLDFHQRGLDERSALLRAAARVRRLVAALLATAVERSEPLPAVVRAAAD